MIMFALEILNLAKIGNSDSDPLDATIGEAIYSIYSLDNADIIIRWNSYPIKLSLKYDISDIWRDIMQMLRFLREIEKSEFTIHWPSSSFFAQWDFKMKDEILVIEAHWMDISGGREALMALRNVSNTIEVDKSYFIEQWHQLLKIVKEDLLKAGFSGQVLSDFNALLTELNIEN